MVAYGRYSTVQYGMHGGLLHHLFEKDLNNRFIKIQNRGSEDLVSGLRNRAYWACNWVYRGY